MQWAAKYALRRRRPGKGAGPGRGPRGLAGPGRARARAQVVARDLSRSSRPISCRARQAQRRWWNRPLGQRGARAHQLARGQRRGGGVRRLLEVARATARGRRAALGTQAHARQHVEVEPVRFLRRQPAHQGARRGRTAPFVGSYNLDPRSTRSTASRASSSRAPSSPRSSRNCSAPTRRATGLGGDARRRQAAVGRRRQVHGSPRGVRRPQVPGLARAGAAGQFAAVGSATSGNGGAQSPRPRIDAVATSSPSRAMVACPEQSNGLSSARLKYFSSNAGLTLAMFTWPMVQLPNWRSVISS